MEIKQHLTEKRMKIDKALDKLLPESPGKNILRQAMRYSVFPGGKRLRPILTLEVMKLLGGKEKKAMAAACAVELIHIFSLIHDDLPCMDNDDYRRGKLTCHRVFGEDIALLAGDALLNEAYTCLIKGYTDKPDIFSRLIFEFNQTIGEKGLIGGQVKDLLLKDKKVNLKTLEEIYLQKTAALFILAVRCGAILGGSGAQRLKFLSDFAKYFGLAFQILDDCSDYKRNSLNCLNLVSLETAQKKIRKYIAQARKHLKLSGCGTSPLAEIVSFVLEK
jgi:geranylgeranyl diphosphate synthase type II